jgi:predicted nucleotidyltransferase component of viral defense system
VIDSAEIHRRATNLQVPDLTVEKDYVLSHILVAIAEEPTGLIFRGGTALAHIYWPDFRLSEDLDFIVDGGLADLRAVVEKAVVAVRERPGLKVEVVFYLPREGWCRAGGRWEAGELLIDVNLNERAYLPLENRTPTIPYADLDPGTPKVNTVSLAEIMGNKWYMLMDRIEPRDLFDVWSAGPRGLPFDEVARGHRAKYGFLPLEIPRKRFALFQPLWEARLSHQVANLPTFEDVVADVDESYRAWANDRERKE